MKALSPIVSKLCATLALTLAAAPAFADGYVQRNLVSDGSITAEHTDPNLQNPWGVVFNPTGPVWVNDNRSGLSTLYDGDGNIQPLVVTIPTATAATGGNPTGIVFNNSTGFVVSQNGASAAAKFIFATEQGVISAWSPTVDPTHSIRVAGNSAGGAVYKGLAIGANGSGERIYATDFFNARVDVFDSNFKPVSLPAGAFTDSHIPAGFAPFGVQAIGGDIYVTYAKQAADKAHQVFGLGQGFVDAYTPDGKLVQRVAARGLLNAPWGLAMAPAGFGSLGNTLLIGNFGDGHINAYEPLLGIPVGIVEGSNHRPFQIDGLWGLAFGSGFADQPTDTLFFTAGPGKGAHGVYGRLDAQ